MIFAQHKSVIILWEEDDAKQLYLVVKVSCQRTNNLQPGTTIIKKFTVNFFMIIVPS